MAYYQVFYIDNEQEVFNYRDFDDEAQELIDRVESLGCKVTKVLEVSNVTEHFNIQ